MQSAVRRTRVTEIPAAWAAVGFSPQARMRKPRRVWRSTKGLTAMAITASTVTGSSNTRARSCQPAVPVGPTRKPSIEGELLALS